MARRFTLLEMLVAVALSTILMAVLATAFRFSTRSYAKTLDIVDEAREQNGTLRLLEADAQRAAALAELPRFFVVGLQEQPVGRGPPARIDELELTVLADDPTRLIRVRYAVRWDPQTERGVLVRQVRPVHALDLPEAFAFLASTDPQEEQVVLDDVTWLRWRLPVEGGYADPPAADLADETPWVTAGLDASVRHYDLHGLPGAFRELGAESLVWLKDDLIDQQRLREGYRPIRHRVDDQTLVSSWRLGYASGRVAWRAAFLPDHLSLEVESAGRRIERVLPLPSPNQALYQVFLGRQR